MQEYEEKDALNLEALKGPFEQEPPFGDTDEDDDQQHRTVFRCASCPVGGPGCRFKPAKFWSYVSGMKVRRQVMDHLINAGNAHGSGVDQWFHDAQGAAASIAIDPDQTIIEDNFETFDDRQKMRADWKIQAEKQAAAAAAAEKKKGGKGKGKAKGKGKWQWDEEDEGSAQEVRGQKRPLVVGTQSLSNQVEVMQAQLAALASSVQGGASSGSASADIVQSIEPQDPLQSSMAGAMVPAKKPATFIKLGPETLVVMEQAFQTLSEDVTDAIKNLSKVSGNLAKSEAEISKILKFVRTLKQKL